MKPAVVLLGSAAFSRWIPLNWRAMSGIYAIGLGVKLTPSPTLTYTVQHTFDNPWASSIDWSASRTTTTGTITKIAHGLSVDDWTQFDATAPFNAAYSVASVVDADNFTVTVANSGATSVLWGSRQIHTAKVFNHADLAAKTASADGNYAFPARACRLILTAWTTGTAELTVVEAG